MAEQDMKISDLTTTTEVAASDLAIATIADPDNEGSFLSRKITFGNLAAAILNAFSFPLLITKTVSKTIIGALNEISFKEFTATLTAGSTTVTISDALITASSMIDVWVDSSTPIAYESIEATTGSVVITFEAQSADLPVKVRVK